MNKKSLHEWYPGAVKSGRTQLTVPPNVIELSCGCKRETTDPEFEARCVPGMPWVHCGYRGCLSPLDLPVMPPFRPKTAKELKFNYPEHAPYLVRPSC